MNNYIVYQVTYKDKIVYIGSGKEDRYLHTKSGTSHNLELNRLYFTDPDNVITSILRSNLSKEESLEIELGFIKAIQPIYNTVGTNSHGHKIAKGRERAKRKRKTEIIFQ